MFMQIQTVEFAFFRDTKRARQMDIIYISSESTEKVQAVTMKLPMNCAFSSCRPPP